MLVSLGDNGDDDEAFSFQQAALEEEAEASGTTSPGAWSQVGSDYNYEDGYNYCCSANTLTAWKRQCSSDWWR